MAPKKTATRKAAAEKSAAVGRKEGAKRASRKSATIASEAEYLAITAARIADETKAENIVVLDVSAVSSITDFFVLCTGSSLPHLKAIVRDVRHKVFELLGVKPRSSEGQAESQWLVLDFGTVMVHAFHQSKRELYALEDLWSDARPIDWMA
ncbi:MAG: ribosome silencing factor [Verrucomicrobiales bacterium]